MSETIKCFVCHVKTDDWRNDLRGLKSQHSSTFVTDFIRKILGGFSLAIDIDDASNCICADCLNRFEEYDWTCTMARQYEQELYELLVKTEALRNSEPKGDAANYIDPGEKIEKTFGDPLTEYSEQPIRNDEVDVEDELLKVMVEPLDLLIKDKPSDDEQDPEFELDSGAVENQQDDPDFGCKIEGDSSYDDNEDDDYVPQKRKTKMKKVKVSIASKEDPNAPAPKKRGRKPKNREPGEMPKPRKKREKKSYECKDCEKTFEKLVEYVVI